MANGATVGTYVLNQSPTATYDWRAVFATPSDEGVNGSTSPTVRVTVTGCSGSCPPERAGRVERQQRWRLTMSKAMPRWAILVAGTLARCRVHGRGIERAVGSADGSAARHAVPVGCLRTVRRGRRPRHSPRSHRVAELVIDGDRYPGEVGGYTWDGYSQSAPWLPASGLSPVEVSADAVLSVELAGGETGIASWTAQVADAADPAAATTRPLGSGETTVDIVGPGPGAWVMEVRVTYADARGDGAYYWQLVVP